MANRLRGEAEFSANGKTYKFKFGANEIVTVEQALDKPWGQILKEVAGDDLKMGTLRTLIWAGLKRHSPELTIDEAGELMDLPELAKALDDALPKADESPRPMLKAANS